MSSALAVTSSSTNLAPSVYAIDNDECLRTRTSLHELICNDRAFTFLSQIDNDEAYDYAFFRQRYLDIQQMMENTISQLRGRLRAVLNRGSQDMQRLAAVDMIMEEALIRQERLLFSQLPNLLEGHFEHLRHPAAEVTAPAHRYELESIAKHTLTDASHAWQYTFGNDMRDLLLAELDVRLQPAEGLLAALRTR